MPDTHAYRVNVRSTHAVTRVRGGARLYAKRVLAGEASLPFSVMAEGRRNEKERRMERGKEGKMDGSARGGSRKRIAFSVDFLTLRSYAAAAVKPPFPFPLPYPRSDRLKPSSIVE